jgi:signal transduction histidine kinase/DNA-binding response OmpR family regulator
VALTQVIDRTDTSEGEHQPNARRPRRRGHTGRPGPPSAAPAPDLRPARADGRHPFADELDELTAQAVRWTAAGALAVNFCLLVGVGLAGLDPGRADVWVVSLALSGLPALALVLLRLERRLAAGALLLGLAASVFLARGMLGWGEAIFALPLVVFVAPQLIGPRGAVGLAVGGGAALFLDGPSALAPAALVAISAGLSWIAYRPMRTMLGWAWAGYLEERRKTIEVRQRQAELAQLSKSLADVVERLEHANVALAQARRAADEARRLKEEFATAISHELRTPLNLIVGFSEMIANAPDGARGLDAALRGDLATINRNARHLSDLVDDVLELGQLDAHRLALQKDWVPLGRVVDEAVEAVEGLYQRAGLSIEVDVAADLPALYIDATRIRQVLINLLTNAVRYMEEGGATVTARRQEHDVVVSVADTGVGIAPEDVPYVFDSFRQTGPAKRRGGFGLGLTVSKRFVEMHAGSMWVASDPGRGTTFSFTLPLATAVTSLAVAPELRKLEGTVGSDGARPTVLVLDRHKEAATIFRRYLDDYRVIVAVTPAEAIRAARSGLVGAVVVVSGGEHDTALERATLRHLPGVPVVRCDLHTVARAGRELGAAAFLSKPFGRDRLRETLRRLRLRPRRVLVVDDEPEMVRLLGRMLRTIAPECTVLSTTDGQTGLSLGKAEQPDLVLLDLLMPELDGHAFLRAWRADERTRDVPVVIVSAASEEDHDVVSGESLQITRDGGLSVAELMRAVRSSLDGLLVRPASR